MDYEFTSAQILHKLAGWQLEPLTARELNHIIVTLIPADYPDTPLETFHYGENDIESLILEIISEIDDDDEDFTDPAGGHGLHSHI